LCHDAIHWGLFAHHCARCFGLRHGGGDPPISTPPARSCTAQFTTAGTFAYSTPPPTGYTGCWPIGTWTFTATRVMNDCSPEPMTLPQYQIKRSW